MNNSQPNIKKALLLAAGKGERLRPLTLTKPKPLIPFLNKEIILYSLSLLKLAGVKEVYVNAYYLAEQIEDFLKNKSHWGIKIEVIKEPELLGTGGALKNAQRYFENEENFIVMNSDMLCDVSLLDLFHFHLQHSAWATLLLHSVLREDVKRLVHVNETHRVECISEKAPQNVKTHAGVFCGVQILTKDVFSVLQKEGPSCLIQDVYLPALKQGKKVIAKISDSYFKDLGTLQSLKQAEENFHQSWPLSNLSSGDLLL